MYGTHTLQQFNEALQTFKEGCEVIREKSYGKPMPLVVQHLRKRVRLVADGSVYCFVDYKTGDVLKAASWAAPAEHARGNIYASDCGLTHMGPYGPAYLR